MNKKILLSLFAIFFLVITLNFVVSVDVCCVEPIDSDEKWCRDLPKAQAITECKIWRPTVGACAGYPGCNSGICVSGNSGECVSSSWKDYCESQFGSTWYNLSKSEIIIDGLKICQEGCCIYGDSSNILTFSKCKAIAGSQGVDFDFDPTITDVNTCVGLTGGTEEVACIIQDDFSRDCYRTTEEECLSVGGDPEEGFLCTAPQLFTNCARSEKTICFKDKVYFTDTCGNRANVYVEAKYNNTDYWTKIKSSNQSCSIPSSASYSSTCGNCNEIEGTICRDYGLANQNTLNQNLVKPSHGDNICASMDCYYDTNGNKDIDLPTEFYLHGETWCAESMGTIFHINLTNGSEPFNSETRKMLINFIPGTLKNGFNQYSIESYNEYNVPGSKYTRLYCADGKVHEDSCADFRQEICMESNMGSQTNNFRVANCMKNDYMPCLNHTSKTSCEKGVFCKWIYGHRFDGKNLNSIEDREEENQGSCIPLFAPGVKFWASEEEEINVEDTICKFSNFGISIRYETSIWRSRSNLEGKPFCDTSSGERNFDRTSDCQNNCYALPTYGQDDAYGPYFSLEDLMGLHKGIDLSETLDNTCLSDRKSHYCEGKTGPISGASPNCAGNPGDRKIMPLFFRHDEWLLSIKDRARSMGDCGYKKGILMQDFEGLDPELESVYTIFEMDSGSYDAKKLYGGDFLISPTITLN